MDINKAEQISKLYQKIQYYSNRIDSLTRSYDEEFSIYAGSFHSFDLSKEDVLFLNNHYIEEKEKLEKKLKEIK